MAECIEHEDAITALENLAKPYYKSGLVYDRVICAGINTALREVQSVPAVDVRPVVRGRWKRVDPRSTVVTFRCSECNYYAHMNATKYCPNCGADMRQGEEPESLTYISPEERSEVDDG